MILIELPLLTPYKNRLELATLGGLLLDIKKAPFGAC